MTDNATVISEAYHPYCVNGTPFYPLKGVRIVVGATCGLSMVGSLLIVLSYIMIPSIRTKAREILLHLSLMDFMAAAANLSGVIANYEYRLSHLSSSHGSYHVVKNLCLAQASFAMYGTESSVLWTICMAVYIYIRVMYDSNIIVKRTSYFFYVLCYGLPCVLTVWFALTGKLGYAKFGGSGWCSVIMHDEDGHRTTFNPFFSNDLWIYLTIVLVPLIFFSLHFHLRSEMKSRMSSSYMTSAVSKVETKMIVIPVVFILLRVWSLLFVIITVEAGQSLSCPVVTFFLYVGGIGDSGQGFANGILFCLLTPKVRRHFLRALVCYSIWKNRRRRRRRIDSALTPDVGVQHVYAGVEPTCTTETDPLLGTYPAPTTAARSLLVSNLNH